MNVHLEQATGIDQAATVRMTLAPLHWWSSSWAVSQDGIQLTPVELLSGFSRRAVFEIGERKYQLAQEWRTADIVLRHEGQVVCRASKRFLSREYRVSFQRDEFTLTADSLLGSKLILRQGDSELGQISFIGWWFPKIAARLPTRLPVEFRVFCLWLAVEHWSRRFAS